MVVKRATFMSVQVFDAIKPVIIITRSVGLCPISYEENGTGYVIRWSPKYMFLSYAMAIMLALAAIWGVLNDLRVEEALSVRMKTANRRYITCCDIAMIIFMVLFGVLTTPFKLKDLWRAMDRLQKIDQHIKPLAMAKWCNALVLLIFFLFSGLVLYDMGMWIRTTSYPFTFILNYLPFYLMYYIVIVQQVYYWYLISLVGGRLKSLSKWLETRLGNIFKLNIINKQYMSAVNPAKLSGSRKLDVQELLNVTQVHDLICEMIECINHMWGFSVLLIVVSCLVHLIVTPYFLLLEITNNGNLAVICLETFWTVTHILRILGIVQPCHDCMEENKNNLNLIFKLLNVEGNEEARKQLLILSQQVTQRTTYFSSCGLIKIDRSLLTAVAGSVTTYLVILFQFLD